MLIGSILKKTVQILATNPVARKKAGDLAVKAYKSAKPVIDETKKNIKKKLKNNFIK
jgi:hypothetical protein